jgi:hypothetical protein
MEHKDRQYYTSRMETLFSNSVQNPWNLNGVSDNLALVRSIVLFIRILNSNIPSLASSCRFKRGSRKLFGVADTEHFT